MAKISPVSIKYMVHANFVCEGALEKPDVIGAIFGQTEGLLGAELEMRELQKEGKIGRIEVQLDRQDKRTIGTIQIPTALDQSETTLIAASLETIERVGPSDTKITIEEIEIENIGDESRAFYIVDENNFADSFGYYRIQFRKKNVRELIIMTGNVKNFEVLKEFVRNAEKKI